MLTIITTIITILLRTSISLTMTENRVQWLRQAPAPTTQKWGVAPLLAHQASGLLQGTSHFCMGTEGSQGGHGH